MRSRNASGGVSTTRRRFLAASGTALLTAVAGCSAVADFVGDMVLKEVNVLNQLNRKVEGSVTVTDPAGDTALDETFDVPSNDEDGEGNTATYGDVWGDTGDYEISVELTNTEIEGVSQASRMVRIDDTDEDMVAILPNSDKVDEPIAIRVGQSLSDFGQTES
ncbi:MAG: hypothetical protein ABEH88_13330 [Halobacteriales archaeon]